MSENELSLGRAVNARANPCPALPGQQEFIHSFLSGSQRKTAFALRLNAERMIREDGLNSTGFLTLTVGDYFCKLHGKQIPVERNFCPCCMHENSKMDFVRISDAAEASRRFNNLNRRELPALFTRAIAVTERHKSKDIHFHLLGSLAGRPDIRTGLKFEAIAKRDYRSASDALRAIWTHLRDVLPRYGFGRAELLPVKKTGEAVAAYVSKYIEKHVCNRTADDKRKKLVRYIGWEKSQLKANEFEWDGERARAWRGKAREICALVGVELPDKNFSPRRGVLEDCASAAGKIRPKMLDGTHAAEILGSRWAFQMHQYIQTVSDQAVPFMVWDYLTQELVRNELAAHAGARHIRHFERQRTIIIAGQDFSPAEALEYFERN